MSTSPSDGTRRPGSPGLRIEAVRRFNRFYTQQIGVLEEGLLGGPFSLTEVRILYELAHRDGASAAEIRRELGLDAGYLSRLLGHFRRRRLVTARPSAEDGRRQLLRLTAAGRRAFAALDGRAEDHADGMLAPLSDAAQRRLVEAMHTIEELLGHRARPIRTVELRPPRAGDFGWVIHRHGALYASEYGWDDRFEALVAGVVADYARHHDPNRERAWIAEVDGEVAGSVFLVQDSTEVARLRLLLVEPGARGLGIGRRLIRECIGFAQRAGYTRMVLWTNQGLDAARHLYQAAGFRLVTSEPHAHFGHGLVGETWELDLSPLP